jgi:hypothetical protein
MAELLDHDPNADAKAAHGRWPSRLEVIQRFDIRLSQQNFVAAGPRVRKSIQTLSNTGIKEDQADGAARPHFNDGR